MFRPAIKGVGVVGGSWGVVGKKAGWCIAERELDRCSFFLFSYAFPPSPVALGCGWKSRCDCLLVCV